MDTIFQNQTIKCYRHQNFTCQYVNINNPSQENDNFVCVECLDEIDNPNFFKNLLSIEQIVQSSEKTILSKWPPVSNEEILKNFKKSLTLTLQNEELSSEISAIKQNFCGLIDCIQKSYICSFQKLEEVQEDALKCYNQLSDKESFKQIFTANQSYQEIKNKLNSFLIEKKNNTIENSTLLQNLNNNIHSFVNEIHNKRGQLNNIKRQIDLALLSINDQSMDLSKLDLNERDSSQNKQIFSSFLHKFIQKNYSEMLYQRTISEQEIQPQAQELLKHLDQIAVQICLEKDIEIDILKYTNVLKPKFRQFDELLDVEKKENEILIKKKESEKWDNISYVERPFESSQKYIIHLNVSTNCEFSPLNQIYFGFTFKNSINNIDYISNTKYGFLFRGSSSSLSSYGQSHMKKGSLSRLQKEYTQFEVRISQSEGILEISDYPLHENIVELDPSIVDTFKNSEKLIFGFEIYAKNNQISLTGIKKVLQFPAYS